MDFEKQTTDKSQMQPEFQDVSLIDSGKEKNPQYSSAKSDWTQPVYDDMKKISPEDFFVATCEGGKSDTQATGTTDLGAKDTMKDENMFKGQEALTGGNGSKMAESGTTLGGAEQKMKDTKKDKDISKKDKDTSKKDKDIAKKNKDKLKKEEKEKEKLKGEEKEKFKGEEREKEKKKKKEKEKGEEKEKEKEKMKEKSFTGDGSTMADATKIPLKKGKSKNGGSKMADIKDAVGTEFREDKDKTNRDINIGREQNGLRDMDTSTTTNLLNKDKDQKLTSDLSQQREGDLLNRQSK